MEDTPALRADADTAIIWLALPELDHMGPAYEIYTEHAKRHSSYTDVSYWYSVRYVYMRCEIASRYQFLGVGSQ